MKLKAKPSVQPVYCLADIFTTRRDLLEPIRTQVMPGSPVTVDEADVLVYLYGNRELGWTSLPLDPDGFVVVGTLRQALVHDRGLFSRRISRLIKLNLLEGRQPADRPPRSRQYVSGVRITNAGSKVAKGIWTRYCKLAETLLAGVTSADLAAHHRVNHQIMAAIRKLKQAGLK